MEQKISGSMYTNPHIPWDASLGCIHCFCGHYQTLPSSRPMQEVFPGQLSMPYTNVMSVTAESSASCNIPVVKLTIKRNNSIFGDSVYILRCGDLVTIAYASAVVTRVDKITGTITDIKRARQFGEDTFAITIKEITTGTESILFTSNIRHVNVIDRRSNRSYEQYDYRLKVAVADRLSDRLNNREYTTLMISTKDCVIQKMYKATTVRRTCATGSVIDFDISSDMFDGVHAVYLMDPIDEGDKINLINIGNICVDHINNLCVFIDNISAHKPGGDGYNYNVSVIGFGPVDEYETGNVSNKPISMTFRSAFYPEAEEYDDAVEEATSDYATFTIIPSGNIRENDNFNEGRPTFSTRVDVNRIQTVMLYNYDVSVPMALELVYDHSEYHNGSSSILSEPFYPNIHDISMGTNYINAETTLSIRYCAAFDGNSAYLKITDWDTVKEHYYINNSNIRANMMYFAADELIIEPLQITPNGYVMLPYDIASYKSANQIIRFECYEHIDCCHKENMQWIAEYTLEELGTANKWNNSINITLMDRLQFAIEFSLHQDWRLIPSDNMFKNITITREDPNPSDTPLEYIYQGDSVGNYAFSNFFTILGYGSYNINVTIGVNIYKIPFKLYKNGNHTLYDRINIEDYQVVNPKGDSTSDPTRCYFATIFDMKTNADITNQTIMTMYDTKTSLVEVRVAKNGKNYIPINLSDSLLCNSNYEDIVIEITRNNFASTEIYCPIRYKMSDIVKTADPKTNFVQLPYYNGRMFTLRDSSNSVFDHAIEFSIRSAEALTLPYHMTYVYNDNSGAVKVVLIEGSYLMASYVSSDDTTIPTVTNLGLINFDEHGVLQFTNYLKNCTEISAQVDFRMISPEATPRPEEFNIEEAEPASSDDITALFKKSIEEGETNNE